MVPLDKISENNVEKALGYALKAERLGFKSIYLEAGSGADAPVPDEMISKIREKINITIVVGGGIRDAKTAREKVDAGADAVVNGTLIDKDERLSSLKDIIIAVKR